MLWAKITILVLFVLNLGFTLGLHGKPKGGKYNFWSELICTIIMLWLYYEAGLFNGII